MIDHSDKKLDYALRAIQHPQLRETDEFLQWIGIPENKELFLELMACKEAVIRENLQRKRKYRKKMRILAIASSVAAVLILAFLIPSLLPSTSLPAEQPIRFFAANNNDEHVVLQMDGRSEQQLLTDSVMDVKDWKTVSADTVCCQTLTTPRGKDFLLVLADGTKVWLNAESRLRYPVAFHGKERRVELEGEACFEVAKDAEHPFIVCANGMNTMVLGTKFNVRSYSVEDRHVTLVNGKVQVTNTVNNKSVTLRPGQDLTYTETGEEKVSEVNIATYTAWTEGMFYFEDVPLEEIMGALGRWYNVNIDFERCELYHIRLNFWANKNTHLDEALELTNAYAPEHLIIETENYMEVAERVTNAGSVFLGSLTPESAGDYASGTNHTLPTNGYAKAYSGVSLDSFIRKITFQEILPEGIKAIGPAIEEMAANEHLDAHKNAVTVRLKAIQNS